MTRSTHALEIVAMNKAPGYAHHQWETRVQSASPRLYDKQGPRHLPVTQLNPRQSSCIDPDIQRDERHAD